MAKAFDSVSLDALEIALLRIKVPSRMVEFIKYIYDKRKIRVITAYGLSSPFIASDGIDQGETISPLMWRVFYDPLLNLVQNRSDLGYTMAVEWPTLEHTAKQNQNCNDRVRRRHGVAGKEQRRPSNNHRNIKRIFHAKRCKD